MPFVEHAHVAELYPQHPNWRSIGVWSVGLRGDKCVDVRMPLHVFANLPLPVESTFLQPIRWNLFLYHKLAGRYDLVQRCAGIVIAIVSKRAYVFNRW